MFSRDELHQVYSWHLEWWVHVLTWFDFSARQCKLCWLLYAASNYVDYIVNVDWMQVCSCLWH